MNALDPVTLEIRCDEGDRVGIGWVTALSAAREAVARVRDNPCPETLNGLTVAIMGVERQASRARDVADELRGLLEEEWTKTTGVQW